MPDRRHGEDALVRARRIRCLACDVDGTLTDGGIYYASDGTEARRFHIRDGLGIVAARASGMRIVWISGRDSSVVRRRSEELGVDLLLQGVSDKSIALEQVAHEFAIDMAEIAFIGDDLNDLPGLRVSGLSFAPSDAARDVRAEADVVLEARGGEGAIREALEWILECRDEWDSVRSRYVASLSGQQSFGAPRRPSQ